MANFMTYGYNAFNFRASYGYIINWKYLRETGFLVLEVSLVTKK